MESTLIISDKCIGCGKCVKVCIRGHLQVIDKRAAETESAYSCFRCGHCAAVCPMDAIDVNSKLNFGALDLLHSLRWYMP